MGMRNNVDTAHRRHYSYRKIDRARVGRGIVVHPLGECVQIRPKARLLGVIPTPRAAGYVVLDQPDRGSFVRRSPVLGAAATGFTVQSKNLVRVALRLGIAVAVEDGGGVLAVNMRNTVPIPQNLIDGWCRLKPRRGLAADCRAGCDEG